MVDKATPFSNLLSFCVKTPLSFSLSLSFFLSLSLSLFFTESLYGWAQHRNITKRNTTYQTRYYFDVKVQLLLMKIFLFMEDICNCQQSAKIGNNCPQLATIMSIKQLQKLFSYDMLKDYGIFFFNQLNHADSQFRSVHVMFLYDN